MRAAAAAFACASVVAIAGPDWSAAPGSEKPESLASYNCRHEGALEICRLVDPAALRIGSIPASGQTLIYRSERLERISTTVAGTDFDRLRQWLTATFGAGSESVEQLRAGMGGTFPNVTVTWQTADRCVLLEQHFERVTQSGVSVMDCNALRALLRGRERQRVRGLRDF